MNYYQNNFYAYVQGYEGAKAYQNMPNQNVLLIDSENPYIYMKSSNAIGQSTIQCFKIESVDEAEMDTHSITRDDIKEIIKRLEALEGKNHEPTIQCNV